MHFISLISSLLLFSVYNHSEIVQRDTGQGILSVLFVGMHSVPCVIWWKGCLMGKKGQCLLISFPPYQLKGVIVFLVTWRQQIKVVNIRIKDLAYIIMYTGFFGGKKNMHLCVWQRAGLYTNRGGAKRQTMTKIKPVNSTPFTQRERERRRRERERERERE